jgi:signal transduction histidine kinase
MIKEFDAELRHLNAVKGNFEISDGGKEYVATASLQKAKPLKHLIHSNVKEIGEQQQYVFDTLWNKAIASEEKIKEIEEGIIPEVTEIIHNHDEVQSMEWHLLEATKEEVQIIYSTVKAYKLQESLGVMDYLAKLSNSGINVRMLTPKDSSIEKSLQNLKTTSTINVKYLETESGIKNKYLITDRKNSLVIELKDEDDNIDKYYNFLRKMEDEKHKPITSLQSSSTILGIAISSNTKSTVSSYISIFETLWNQTELFQELKQADILKTEFINIAAHELRTPTQSIIGYCEMLEAFPDKKENFLSPIKRNAERLYKLTQDILDVAKIESNLLKLDIEKVDLNEILEESIREFCGKSSNIKKDIKVNFNANANNKILAFADKNRIQQVIFNLLDNASKFTEKGEINLSIEKDNDNNEATIRIQDTGTGIDSEILPRLFEKFATKSDRGTGLGLYISKNIVEAHGGRIWIENNNNNNANDSKGTVFLFTLPLATQH